MTSSVRQIVFHDPGAPGFAAYIQTSFASATLAGSTLLIFSTVSNFAGTVVQLAQNVAGGSPAATGDATNGTYSTVEIGTDTGNQGWGIFAFQNAAAVSAGTTFTANFSAGDDYIGIVIVEVTGVATSSIITSVKNLAQVVAGAGTDNITSGTAVLGSSACITIAMSADGVNSSGPTHGTGFTDLGSGWGWGTGTNPGPSQGLESAGSGRCLDVPGLNTANATLLDIWDCNGGANQLWALPTT